MKQLARLTALALLLPPAGAGAQTIGKSVQFPSGYAPGEAPCVLQPNDICTPVSAANPLPVTGGAGTPTGSAGTPNASVVSVQGVAGGTGIDIVVRGSSTDRGGVVGTSAVTLAAANTARRGFAIQVQAAASVSCYVNGIAAAGADYHSLQIGGGGYYQTPDSHVGTGAISVICTAASTPVFMREW